MAIKSIDVAGLKKLIDSNDVVLIDVREPGEYNAENIDQATLIPLAEVNLKVLPEIGDKKLVIHCRSGKRSMAACERLFEEDHDLEVYNLEGGILAWAASGSEVKSSGSFFLPLDRQVQLSVGLSLLVFSLFGYFVSQVFFVLTGFIGLGLTIAGLTGYCGLAKILAKMPWNSGKTIVSYCSIGK